MGTITKSMIGREGSLFYHRDRVIGNALNMMGEPLHSGCHHRAFNHFCRGSEFLTVTCRKSDDGMRGSSQSPLFGHPQDQNSQTVQVGVHYFLFTYSANYAQAFAATVMAIIPTVLAYMFQLRVSATRIRSRSTDGFQLHLGFRLESSASDWRFFAPVSSTRPASSGVNASLLSAITGSPTPLSWDISGAPEVQFAPAAQRLRPSTMARCAPTKSSATCKRPILAQRVSGSREAP